MLSYPRIAAIAATAVTAALLLVGAGCASKATAPEPVRPAVVAHPAAAAGMNAEVYTGDVHARYESTLGFRVAGKISARRVDMGAHVSKGQVLAVLDPDDARLAVSGARAALASAQADHQLAESERDRYRAVLAKNLISQSLFDVRETTLRAAAARVEQARAQLAVAENQAEYMELKADRNGVVTSVSAESGQVVAAGQTIVTLAEEGEMEVEINVPEGRISDLASGQQALVELWSESGKRYAARIREIAPEADRASRTYRTRVSIIEPDAGVQLGKTARVYLADAAIAGTQLVPLTALHELDGKPALWIVDPATLQVNLRPVRIGAYREEGVTVVEGLQSSDWLVVAGVHKLNRGQAIRPVDRANRPVKF